MGKSRNISQVLNDQGLIEAADLAPGVGTPEQGFNFRNRIINGDMRIDQRNAGAALSTFGYAVDRFSFSMSTNKGTLQQNAGGVTPPTGFKNYWGFTTTSAYSITAGDYFGLQQRIEGYNLADMGFGATGASTFTVSFWVRSSLTGTFGFNLQNGAQTRSFAATYTISAANTWEYKTITVAGDTTGAWLTNNGVGLVCSWGIGVGSTFNISATGAWQTTTSPNGFGTTGATSVVGTNGATFYITGVQLEAGSVATPFERRPYGTELMLCQRYYQELGAISYTYYGGSGSLYESGIQSLLVSMRTPPSFSTSSISYYSGVVTSMTPTIYNGIVYATTSVSSAGYGGFYGTVKASAEL